MYGTFSFDDSTGHPGLGVPGKLLYNIPDRLLLVVSFNWSMPADELLILLVIRFSWSSSRNRFT